MGYSGASVPLRACRVVTWAVRASVDCGSMTSAAAVADRIESELAPLHTEVSHAWWELNVLANEENERRRVELETALSDFLADGERFAAIESGARARGRPCPAQARPPAQRLSPAAGTRRDPQADHRARGLRRDALLTASRRHRGPPRRRQRDPADPPGERRRRRAPRRLGGVEDRRGRSWPTTCASSRACATQPPTHSASGTGSHCRSRPRRWTRRS